MINPKRISELIPCVFVRLTLELFLLVEWRPAADPRHLTAIGGMGIPLFVGWSGTTIDEGHAGEERGRPFERSFP